MVMRESQDAKRYRMRTEVAERTGRFVSQLVSEFVASDDATACGMNANDLARMVGEILGGASGELRRNGAANVDLML